MAADSALGEKKAMLGMGVLVMMSSCYASNTVPGRDGKSEEIVWGYSSVQYE